MLPRPIRGMARKLFLLVFVIWVSLSLFSFFAYAQEISISIDKTFLNIVPDNSINNLQSASGDYLYYLFAVQDHSSCYEWNGDYYSYFDCNGRCSSKFGFRSRQGEVYDGSQVFTWSDYNSGCAVCHFTCSGVLEGDYINASSFPYYLYYHDPSFNDYLIYIPKTDPYMLYVEEDGSLKYSINLSGLNDLQASYGSYIYELRILKDDNDKEYLLFGYFTSPVYNGYSKYLYLIDLATGSKTYITGGGIHFSNVVPINNKPLTFYLYDTNDNYFKKYSQGVITNVKSLSSILSIYGCNYKNTLIEGIKYYYLVCSNTTSGDSYLVVLDPEQNLSSILVKNIDLSFVNSGYASRWTSPKRNVLVLSHGNFGGSPSHDVLRVSITREIEEEGTGGFAGYDINAKFYVLKEFNFNTDETLPKFLMLGDDYLYISAIDKDSGNIKGLVLSPSDLSKIYERIDTNFYDTYFMERFQEEFSIGSVQNILSTGKGYNYYTDLTILQSLTNAVPVDLACKEDTSDCWGIWDYIDHYEVRGLDGYNMGYDSLCAVDVPVSNSPYGSYLFVDTCTGIDIYKFYFTNETPFLTSHIDYNESVYTGFKERYIQRAMILETDPQVDVETDHALIYIIDGSRSIGVYDFNIGSGVLGEEDPIFHNNGFIGGVSLSNADVFDGMIYYKPHQVLAWSRANALFLVDLERPTDLGVLYNLDVVFYTGEDILDVATDGHFIYILTTDKIYKGVLQYENQSSANATENIAYGQEIGELLISPAYEDIEESTKKNPFIDYTGNRIADTLIFGVNLILALLQYPLTWLFVISILLAYLFKSPQVLGLSFLILLVIGMAFNIVPPILGVVGIGLITLGLVYWVYHLLFRKAT